MAGTWRYRVYVIELDRAVLGRRSFRKDNPQARPGKPCVYVGQGALDPEARFAQHKAGIKSNVYAREFGLRLRLRLRSMRTLPAYATRAEAEAAGKRCAARLRARGYAVWSR